MREKREETALFIGKRGNPRLFTLVGRSPNGLSLRNFWARNQAVTILPLLIGIHPRIPSPRLPNLTSEIEMDSHNHTSIKGGIQDENNFARDL
ncbi:hypothetical protein YC2023_076182 [Brassica napus]